ncbi:TetR/AcrR family transcriptional regulator [Pseudonocardia lacus]|uniref:TetR/AcrR family transcriptional regulator n=1 Tax=Pseudonocardia lacus TaxID=2835865 RepID=UPI001BDBF0F1|nr:TetR family transcriptional regulator [Pseudonocardia lacus]
MTEPRRAPRQAEAEANDRALLAAAREVVAVDGARASVAAIAARAGVGIGSLYRRYRTKQELFQRLVSLTLDRWIDAAEQGLAHADPWEGLAHYLLAGFDIGQGSLGSVAGTIELTEEIADKNRRADEAVDALVARARAAGVLRPDVTTTDLHLLVEQLGKSPMIDQLRQQGRTDLVPAAVNARTRITAIALDGLRAPAPHPLPGEPPAPELLSGRWET